MIKCANSKCNNNFIPKKITHKYCSRECSLIQWRIDNKEHRNKINKIYYKKNINKIKKYREDNKKKQREYNKKWRDENKEYKKKYDKIYRDNDMSDRKDYMKKWYEDNRKKQREYKIFKKYGITPEEYKKLFEKQKGRCAICGIEETTIKYNKIMDLCIDHNHNNGNIRGLLCNICNRILGMAKENPFILIKMIEYIKVDKQNGNSTC